MRNTLKEISTSFLPYLYRMPNFLKASAVSNTELVNEAIAKIPFRVFTILREFLGKALPFLQIGIFTRPNCMEKTAGLPKKEEKRKIGLKRKPWVTHNSMGQTSGENQKK